MEFRGNGNFWSGRRWLARLSFSFLVLAGCLVWTAYRGGQTQELSTSRITIFYALSIVSLVLFLLGTRERHRDRDEPPP